MNKLSSIIPEPKSGNETLKFNSRNIGFTLKDFWRWSTSDLMSNATRGIFAEFIVKSVFNLSVNSVRKEWDYYDLETDSGIKIEVKSSAYLQSWNQNNYSKINFSIKSSRILNIKTNKYYEESKRHADIYVFCLLKHKDQSTIDPLKLEQWEFYVVSVNKLNENFKNQNNLSINSLSKIANPVTYPDLRQAIEIAQKDNLKNL